MAFRSPGPNHRQSSSSSSELKPLKHYYQGGYDLEFVDGLDPRHECPICLLCQRDPHQTSCGHRFCYSCILTWLNEGRTCPDDNCSLGEGDIFPDTIANREILQLMVRCPNLPSGCQSVMHLVDVDSHLRQCQHRPAKARPLLQQESQTCPSCGDLIDTEHVRSCQQPCQQLICPNASVACPFTSAGCTDRFARKDLQPHLQSQASHHIQLLWERIMKLQQIQNAETCSMEEGTGPESLKDGESALSRDSHLRLSGSNLHSTQKLLTDLFHRVVQLEQKNCHLSIELEQLTIKLKLLSDRETTDEAERIGRFCNGVYVWKIGNFSEHHNKMRHNHQFVTYSRGFYTSVFGYKLCLRCNVNLLDGEEHLGLFIHLMRGVNDDALEWPFKGRMTLTVVNQDDGRVYKENVSETMDTPGGSKAFERPRAERNAVGFGFQEFIRVNGLYSGGFVTEKDVLVVKAVIRAEEEQ